MKTGTRSPVRSGGRDSSVGSSRAKRGEPGQGRYKGDFGIKGPEAVPSNQKSRRNRRPEQMPATTQERPVDPGRLRRTQLAEPGVTARKSRTDPRGRTYQKGKVEGGDAIADRDLTPAQGIEPRDLVWGRHAVLAALKGDRAINKVWMLKGLEDRRLASEVRTLARSKGAAVQEVERIKLDALAGPSHQGIVAALSHGDYVDLETLLATAMQTENAVLLLLDGIEDPHNLGALIRTADAAGATAVMIPQRRAVGLTGAVAKAAAGALERVPVSRVTNLNRAIGQLKKAGFLVVGADPSGGKLAYDVDLTGPVALVVGAEGPGLSRLVKESCDLLVRFPQAGTVPSLNASVAGGLLLFEAVRQRHLRDSAGPEFQPEI